MSCDLISVRESFAGYVIECSQWVLPIPVEEGLDFTGIPKPSIPNLLIFIFSFIINKNNF